MNNNASIQLARVLEGLDNQIKRLESNPNHVFVLIEYETLSLFHYFNVHFKYFWDEFDRNSAAQLLQYKEIVEKYNSLCNSYASLLREQIDYLERRIDLEAKNVKQESLLKFPEDNGTGVIDYYQEYFKILIAAEGRPLQKIFFDSETQSDLFDEKNIPKDFPVFCSYLINDSHYKGLSEMYSSLNRLYFLFGMFSSYKDKLLSGYKPSLEEVIRALERESRKYAKEIGRNVEHELKIAAQYKKSSRHAQLTPDEWGKLMDDEDELYRLAINGQLEESNDRRFENIFEEKRKQLIENSPLLQKIKSTAIDGELFDIRLSVETHNLVSSLNEENLDLFYELILKRNIIQREMYPDKLKAEYEEWSNPSEERLSEDSEDKGLTKARQSKLDEIIGILQKGDWKAPATVENVTQLLNTIFGRDVSLLEDDDEQFCEKMWAFVESGSGNRMKVVPANLAGFFCEQNLLNGSPKSISEDIFGKGINQSNNFNKGYSSRRSNTFKDVIPFITKYTDKIIRQA